MRRRWLEAVAAAALAFHPNLGSAIFGLLGLSQTRALGPRSRWALALAAPLLVPLPFQWLAGRQGGWLALHALAVVALVLVCAGSRTGIARGLTVGLVALATVGLVTQGNGDRLVHPEGQGPLAQLTGVSRLGPRGMYWSAAKEWAVDPATEAVAVEFDLRLVGGEPGVDWYRYHPEIVVEPCDGGVAACSRIDYPSLSAGGGALNLSREFDTGKPLAGRTFRASARLRADTIGSTTGCRGIVLQENGGRFRGACLPVTLSPEWREHVIEWTAPEEVTMSELRVLLNDVGIDLEIADLTVEELVEDGWRGLGHLEPVGLQLTVRSAGVGRREAEAVTVVPGPERERHRVELATVGLVDGGTLRLDFQVEGHVALEIGDLRVESLTDGTAEPVPVTGGRWSLWFPQPNLLGHSAATAGTVLAVVGGPATWRAVGLAAAVALVAQSGSRAALAALLVALLALAAASGPWRYRSALLVALVVAAALVAAAGAGTSARFVSLVDGNVVGRTEIWATALEALAERPFLGVGEGGFSSFWVGATGGWPNVAPVHAHNLVLHLGAEYGWPGVVAAIGFLAVLVTYCWRRLRWRGVALFASLLILNVLDMTMFFPGVLSTALLALQARPDPDPGPARGGVPAAPV